MKRTEFVAATASLAAGITIGLRPLSGESALGTPAPSIIKRKLVAAPFPFPSMKIGNSAGGGSHYRIPSEFTQGSQIANFVLKDFDYVDFYGNVPSVYWKIATFQVGIGTTISLTHSVKPTKPGTPGEPAQPGYSEHGLTGAGGGPGLPGASRSFTVTVDSFDMHGSLWVQTDGGAGGEGGDGAHGGLGGGSHCYPTMDGGDGGQPGFGAPGGPGGNTSQVVFYIKSTPKPYPPGPSPQCILKDINGRDVTAPSLRPIGLDTDSGLIVFSGSPGAGGPGGQHGHGGFGGDQGSGRNCDFATASGGYGFDDEAWWKNGYGNGKAGYSGGCGSIIFTPGGPGIKSHALTAIPTRILKRVHGYGETNRKKPSHEDR